MKIVIAGGNSQAEFILSMFKGKHNQIIVINKDREVADMLVKRCRVPVYHGEPWRKSTLEEAGAYDADVFIALNAADADNFATCIMAKRVFNAKKCICLVDNPKNVDLYEQMGIDSVISSTYLLANTIREESSMETLVKTLSLENDQIVVTEFTILSKHAIAFRKLRDIHFPTKIATISAIKRGAEIIIPYGETELQPKDIVLVVSAPENAAKVANFMGKEAEASSISKLLRSARRNEAKSKK